MNKISIALILLLASLSAHAITLNGDDDSTAGSSVGQPTVITKGSVAPGVGMTPTDIGKTMTGQVFSCAVPQGTSVTSVSCTCVTGGTCTVSATLKASGMVYSTFDANGYPQTRATGVDVNGNTCDTGWLNSATATCPFQKTVTTLLCAGGSRTITTNANIVANDDIVSQLRGGGANSSPGCTASHPTQYVPSYSQQ